jgi:hypothetical protein
MKATPFRAKTLAIILAVLGLGGIAVYWFFVREREEVKPVLAPTCRIVFLSADERVRRANAPIVGTSGPVAPYYQIPADQADNPVLLAGHYAVARFENTTGRPLTLHVVQMRLRLARSVEETAVVHVEVRDASGEVLKGIDPQTDYLISTVDPEPPGALHVTKKEPTFTLQPGEGFDLRMSILGRVTTRGRGLKPGTYTVRASVGYVDAADGQTKWVTSEPVTVTVTEEHIKAAEALWKAQDAEWERKRNRE